MTITDKVDPGYYLFNGSTAILPGRKPTSRTSPRTGRPRALQVQGAYPGQQGHRRALRQVLQAGKPYADKLEVLIMAEAAARDVAFRNKEIDTSILARRSTWPIAPIRNSPRASSKWPRCSPARCR